MTVEGVGFKMPLFTAQKAPPSSAPEPPSMAGQVDVLSRLRIYEGRYAELRKNIVVVEQNMLSHYQKTNRELKDLYTEVSELRRQIIDIQDNVTKIIKELGLLATKSDVNVLKRVIDYLDPVKFARIDQVERMVKEAMSDKSGDEEEESVPVKG
jgi:septal ring factor EnvC (AmiA/AmiB activator)